MSRVTSSGGSVDDRAFVQRVEGTYLNERGGPGWRRHWVVVRPIEADIYEAWSWHRFKRTAERVKKAWNDDLDRATALTETDRPEA